MEEANKSAPADKSNGPGKNKQGGNKRLAIIIGIAAVIVIALVVVIVVLLSKSEPVPETLTIDDGSTAGARGTVVVPENVEEIREQLSKPVEDGYYEVQMNTEWVFDTWDTPTQNAYVANSVNNTRTVFIDVKLADTDELVYSSPYIPLGATLESFTLDKELEAGEYTAVVKYTLVDDDYNEITDLSVSVKLYILA